MKKSLLALAALGLFAGAASAQSTVTLWGIVDLNLKSVKNGSISQRTMGTDGINSSRLGFRGVEDLGGGLKAAFHLEAGMDNGVGLVGGSNGLPTPANGTSFFNRRSTVSLLGGFGEVRLGRDYDPSFWNLTIFDPFGTNGVGSSLNLSSTLGSGIATQVRANNTVGYFLPGGLGGLYGQIQVAPSENVSGQKYAGGRIGFAAGPLDIAVAAGQTETNTVTHTKFKIANIGGHYDFGVVKLQAQLNQSKFQALKLRTALIGVVVPLGQGEIRASYVRADADGGGTDRNDADQVALGYVYNLSKRTALYGQGSRVNNKGVATFAVGGLNNITAAQAGLAGRKSTGFEFGLRHSF